MTEINVSAHTPYHTQVNNTFFPLSTCNTTSAIMWMLDCGIAFECPPDMQPEDYLTTITETPEAYAHMREVAPWAFRNGCPILPPRQVHLCLDWAVNRLAGREMVRFRTDATYQELTAELAGGRAAIMSGIFTRQGHMVCLVGVRTKQDRAELREAGRVRLDQIVGWYVDDPYGDYHSCYTNQHGNDKYFEFSEFDRLTRELYRNRKWAHVYVG
jgi:hypothetical protein